MNAVQYGLSVLKQSIPEMILELTFRNKVNENANKITSLDDRMLVEHIRPHILMDMNVIGGIPIRINIDACESEWLDANEYLIVVPKSMTNNQPIISVDELINPGLGTMNASMCSYNGMLLNTAVHMYNNLATANIPQTARLDLIGENRILISDPSAYPLSGVMRCTIAHNGNLEDIHPRNYPVIAQLFVLGTKAYIFNKLQLQLDQGYLYGGHELSRITDIVDSYSDANEMYREYLDTTWRKTSFLNNADNTARYVKSMLGNVM